MQDDKDAIEIVRVALRSEPRAALRDHPIDVEFTDGTLTLAGGVLSVAAKKLALERTGACPG